MVTFEIPSKHLNHLCWSCLEVCWSMLLYVNALKVRALCMFVYKIYVTRTKNVVSCMKIDSRSINAIYSYFYINASACPLQFYHVRCEFLLNLCELMLACVMSVMSTMIQMAFRQNSALFRDKKKMNMCMTSSKERRIFLMCRKSTLSIYPVFCIPTRISSFKSQIRKPL